MKSLFLLAFVVISVVAQDGRLYTWNLKGDYVPMNMEQYVCGVYLYRDGRYVNVHKRPDRGWLIGIPHERDGFIPKEFHLYTCERNGEYVRVIDDEQYPGGIYLRVHDGFMKVHKEGCWGDEDDPLGSSVDDRDNCYDVDEYSFSNFLVAI